ncbi:MULTISPECIES: hypothetical protein [Nocardia]|uniref:hypothetical protein n=1 Tax=Nocardia TaxID=1817 RepID=UPI0013005706|nr:MULTISPECIES: hypothetical protein [Nocardia]
MSSIDLWFPLDQVWPIAEHAMAAPEHSWSPYDTENPPVPALIWAKDEGTYLLSNGRPRQLDPHRPGHSIICHAVGWTDSHTGLGTTAVGGDDFAEYIALTEHDETTPPLIDLIREFGPHHGWLILTVEPNKYTVAVQRPGPTSPRP